MYSLHVDKSSPLIRVPALSKVATNHLLHRTTQIPTVQTGTLTASQGPNQIDPTNGRHLSCRNFFTMTTNIRAERDMEKRNGFSMTSAVLLSIPSKYVQ